MTICVIVPAYNCAEWLDRGLESIARQTYDGDLDVVIIDDASTDETWQVAKAWAKEMSWVPLRNQRNRKMPHNLRLGIDLLDPEPDDVIFILDGDDFLPEDSFAIIARYYEDPSLWLTYGSYEPWPMNTGQAPAAPYPDAQWQARDFRGKPALYNHPLTFRYKLWRELSDADLQDNSGKWFRAQYDQVIMTPLLEMAAPDHARFLRETLYRYNAINPQSECHLYGTELKITTGEIYQRSRKEPL